MNTEKLKNIKVRIQELKTTKSSNFKHWQRTSSINISIDLISGMMIGVMSGIFTDKLFNSKPLFFIIFTIIGMIAGFNITKRNLNNKKVRK